MKTVGEPNSALYWERFKRLQQRANRLLGSARNPEGVYCFKSFEEFEEWKAAFRLKKRPTSKES